MKLQRILSMPSEELACRSKQQFSKLLDRFKPWNEAAPRCRLDSLTTDAESLRIRAELEAGNSATAAAWMQQRFRRLAPARFFAGASELDPISAASPNFEQHKLECIERAELVLNGEFSILGYGALHFGTPTNWHLDPVW